MFYGKIEVDYIDDFVVVLVYFFSVMWVIVCICNVLEM